MQGYHRDILEHWAAPPPPLLGATVGIQLPPNDTMLTTDFSTETVDTLTKNSAGKHGKTKKSRRHRKVGPMKDL